MKAKLIKECVDYYELLTREHEMRVLIAKMVIFSGMGVTEEEIGIPNNVPMPHNMLNLDGGVYRVCFNPPRITAAIWVNNFTKREGELIQECCDNPDSELAEVVRWLVGMTNIEAGDILDAYRSIG